MEKLVVVVVRKGRRYVAFFIQKMVYSADLYVCYYQSRTQNSVKGNRYMSAAENMKRRQKPLLASLWHIELQSIHMIIQAGYSVASATLHTLSTIRPSLRGRQGQHLAHNFELQTTQFSSDIQSEQTYTTNQVKLQKVIQVKFYIPTHQSQESTLCLLHLRLH